MDAPFACFGQTNLDTTLARSARVSTFVVCLQGCRPGFLQATRTRLRTGRGRGTVVCEEKRGVVEQGLNTRRHAGAVRQVEHGSDVLVRKVVVAVRAARLARIERLQPRHAAVEERGGRVIPCRPGARMILPIPKPLNAATRRAWWYITEPRGLGLRTEGRSDMSGVIGDGDPCIVSNGARQRSCINTVRKWCRVYFEGLRRNYDGAPARQILAVSISPRRAAYFVLNAVIDSQALCVLVAFVPDGNHA